MAEGNGVDLASLAAMVQVLVKGQDELRQEFREFRREFMDLRREFVDLRREFIDLRREFILFREETRQRSAGLEARLNDYHGAVIGHGILITELQDDVRDLKARLPGPS